MNNRQLYQRTFSQVHSRSEIRWEDCALKAKHPALRRLTAGLTSAALILLACGMALAIHFLDFWNQQFSTSQHEPASAPPKDETFDPAKLPEDAAEGTMEEGWIDMPVTMESGQQLTLRIRCRAVASGYGTWEYGVGFMEVWEDGGLLQTIRVADAILAVLNENGLDMYGEDGWTHCFEEVFRPEILDLNFDGNPDIRLMEFLGNVNGSYLHWLWKPELQQFTYAFCLSGYDFRIDEEAGQLVTESRDGWGVYTTNYYAYDEAGNLQQVDSIQTAPVETPP